MVVYIYDGAKLLNFDDIRFLKGVFMVKIGIEDFDNAKVLKGNELLVIDEFKTFDMFMSLYIVDDFLRVAKVIEDDFFP